MDLVNLTSKVWRLMAVAGAASVMMMACAGSPSPTAQPGGTENGRPSQNDNEPSSGDQPSTDPAPEFTVSTFDGAEFSLAEQRGTPVVLNFWESW